MRTARLSRCCRDASPVLPKQAMPRYAGLRSIAQIVERSQPACSFLVGTASSLSRRVIAPMLNAWVWGAAEYADLALLGTMAFAAARTLQDLSAFVFSDHALELQQQLILGRLRLWCFDEDRLHTMAQPFLGQQHLIGVLAAEPIGRQHQYRLDLAFGDEVTYALKTGSNQSRPAEALVLEDPLSRYAVALA